MADTLERSVGGKRNVKASARMSDEHVIVSKHGHDRISAVGKERTFVPARTVPRQIDRDGLVPQLLELRNDAAPARSMKTAVNKYKSHPISTFLFA
jgi:hypothetical protein